MKKIIFSLLFCIVFILTAESQLLTDLNGGKTFALNDGTICAIMKNSKGEMYLFQCADGILKTWKSTDNGTSFNVCDTGLAAAGLTVVRNIFLFKRTVTQSFLFFTAMKNNSDGIYCLGFNNDGVPVLQGTEPINREDVSGEIAMYQPRYIGGGAYCVLYIRGNTLGYTYIDDTDTGFQKQIIDTQPGMKSFTLRGRTEDGEFRECGTYTIDDNGTSRLFYFEAAGGDVLFTSFITACDSAIPPLQVTGKTGQVFIVYIKDNNLYAEKLVNTGWQDMNNGDPVSAGINGMIESFNAFVYDEKLFITSTALLNGERHLYFALCPDAVSYILLNNGNTLSPGSIPEKPVIFSLSDRSILISFLYGPANNIWCRKYKIDSDSWESQEAVFSGSGIFNQVSGLTVNFWYPVLSFIENTVSGNNVSFYQYSYQTGIVSKIVSVPLWPDTTGIDNIKILNDKIFTAQAGASVKLIDCLSGMSLDVVCESVYGIDDSIPDIDFICLKKSDGFHLYSYSIK